MKNFFLISAAALVLSVVAVQSCNKNMQNTNNPPAIELPSAQFTVRICDEHPGISSDSVYRFFAELKQDAKDGTVNFTEGESNSSDYRFTFPADPVKLVITPYNRITFETSEDVNASSSLSCLDIQKLDSRHFRAGGYNFDGFTEIKFWNGSGASENSISIRLEAARSIRLEGFELRLDGKRTELKETDNNAGFRNLNTGEFTIFSLENITVRDWYSNVGDAYSTEDIYELDKASVLEFVGTIPRNATPDNEVVQMIDIVSHRQNCPEDCMDFYPYNSASFPGFRWMPFVKGSINDEQNGYTYTLDGERRQKYYPADLRYRKALVWDVVTHDSDRLAYFWYRASPGGSLKSWWGVVREKANPDF